MAAVNCQNMPQSAIVWAHQRARFGQFSEPFGLNERYRDLSPTDVEYTRATVRTAASFANLNWNARLSALHRCVRKLFL